MDALNEIMARFGGALVLGLACAVGLLAAISWVQASRWRKFERRWRQLTDEASGGDLESLLQDHLRGRRLLEEEVAALRRHADDLEARTRTSKRFVGVVRFDAFPDMGGSQSFALAMYDEKGDGAVVTSLVGRMDCRVYCKPLVAGRSDRQLSQEEERALREARAEGPRSVVS